MVVTMFITVRSVARSRDLYSRVLGGTVVLEENPCIVQLSNSWIGENYQAPRSWTERAYHNLIYFNEVDKGGHFAAWERPLLFSLEVRAGFRPLRH
jgi:hypothetical protein